MKMLVLSVATIQQLFESIIDRTYRIAYKFVLGIIFFSEKVKDVYTLLFFPF